MQILAGRDTQQLFSRQLGIKPVVTHQTSGVECAAERDVQQDQAVAVTFNGTFNPGCLVSHKWLHTTGFTLQTVRYHMRGEIGERGVT